MAHGWQGRAGRLLRAGVGAALLCGPAGCFSADKSKLLDTKPKLPSSLPPPNLPGAGPMPPTPPGGHPTAKAGNGATISTASRTAETTPAPTAIPNYSPPPTNHAELIERASSLAGGRPNQDVPFVPSPTPGIQHPPPVRPAAAPANPPAVALGMPNEQPIARTDGEAILPPSAPDIRTPSLPTADGPAPSAADGPALPVGPLAPLAP